VEIEWSDHDVVLDPAREGDTGAPPRATRGASAPKLPSIVAVSLIALVFVVLGLTRGAATKGDAGQRAETTPSTSPSEEASSLAGTSRSSSDLFATEGRSNVRVIGQLDAPVLGVEIDAIAISTGFDGRLVAVDLDSGIVTRSRIRAGNFVTVDGSLAIQTGCGGWQIIEVPSFDSGRELVGCDSYRPAAQLGGDVVFFTRVDTGGPGDLLMSDGRGGLTSVGIDDLAPESLVSVTDGRLLLETESGEIVWTDSETGVTELYVEGELLAARPHGVLWTRSCEEGGRCEVWFGTPDDPFLSMFVVDSYHSNLPVRLNHDASRAVFFKEDNVLRVLTIETGHARELPNPGVSAGLATWSPDGLWLLEESKAVVIALNTLNGRSVEFAGVPGDVSPGWIAMLAKP
jgi:hypothetical protein